MILDLETIRTIPHLTENVYLTKFLVISCLFAGATVGATSSFISFLPFVRLFWNHVLTWVSVRPNSEDSSARLDSLM